MILKRSLTPNQDRRVSADVPSDLTHRRRGNKAVEGEDGAETKQTILARMKAGVEESAMRVLYISHVL